MTLTEFLLARIAEDEDRAGMVHESYGPEDLEPMRDRVLAECEAKRRIVGQWREVGYTGEDGAIIGGEGPETHHEVLRFLAMPYADHPDFNPDWKP